MKYEKPSVELISLEVKEELMGNIDKDLALAYENEWKGVSRWWWWWPNIDCTPNKPDKSYDGCIRPC